MKGLHRGLGPIARWALVLAPAILAACGPPAAEPIVAVTTAGPITTSEYQSWLNGHGKSDTAEQRPGNLGSLAVVRELADRFGERPEATGERHLFALRRLETKLLARAFRATVRAGVEVSDAEVAAELEQRAAERTQPRRIQLNSLFKSVDPADPEGRRRVRAAMEALRQRILAGEEFAALAATESEAQSRLRGGRVGIVRPGQLPPKLEEVAFALAEGELSPVLESELGFTLLQVSRIIPASTMPLDEAEGRIRRYLEKRAQEAAWEAELANLRRASEVTLAPELVASAPTTGTQVDPHRKLATAGDASLTRREFEWLLEELPSGAVNLSPDQARAHLQRWADLELAAARARELDLVATDPALTDRLLWQRFELAANRELDLATEEGLSEPDEATLRARYEAEPGNYRSPVRYDCSLLRIPVDAAAPRASALRIVELARRIGSDPSTFAAIARQESDLPSASEGGRLGWRSARQLAWTGPAILGTLQRLRPGETSQPLTQDGGRWLVHLHAKEPARQLSFTAARADLMAELVQEQAKSRRQELMRETLATLALEIVETEP